MMPTITIDLTDTQAGKIMALNGWKPEDLSLVVKRLIVERISAAPMRTATPPTPADAHVTRTPILNGEDL